MEQGLTGGDRQGKLLASASRLCDRRAHASLRRDSASRPRGAPSLRQLGAFMRPRGRGCVDAAAQRGVAQSRHGKHSHERSLQRRRARRSGQSRRRRDARARDVTASRRACPRALNGRGSVPERFASSTEYSTAICSESTCASHSVPNFRPVLAPACRLLPSLPSFPTRLSCS